MAALEKIWWDIKQEIPKAQGILENFDFQDSVKSLLRISFRYKFNRMPLFHRISLILLAALCVAAIEAIDTKENEQ